MKKTPLTLLVIASSIAAANAATVLETKNPFVYDAAEDQGNWSHQSLTLNDAGFISTGDTLAANVSLNSFSVFRDNAVAATGEIWLAALTVQGDITSTVTVSNGTLNFGTAAQGDTMTFNFDANNLSTSTQYFFTSYVDDGDGVFETDGSDVAGNIRVANVGDVIAGGSGGQTKDWTMQITTTNVPEPSSTALLGLGGLALLLRRRK